MSEATLSLSSAIAAEGQAGSTGIELGDSWEVSPRSGVGESEGEEERADELEFEKFEDFAEKIVYGLQKADGRFYGVSFVQKGTCRIEAIFTESKILVKQAGVVDLDELIGLLKDAGAPGVT